MYLQINNLTFKNVDKPTVRLIGEAEGGTDVLIMNTNDMEIVLTDVANVVSIIYDDDESTAAVYDSFSDVVTVITENEIGGIKLNLEGTGGEIPAHQHEIGDISGLEDALNQKAPTDHTHTIDDVGGLQSALDSKYESGSAATLLSLVLTELPTEGEGLEVGTVWNDRGTLRIVE